MNRPDTPLFATINVTTVCNLDCKYCFMQPLSGETMAREDYETVLDQLADGNIFFLNISGGEPFMHPEIGDFLRMAHARFEHVMTLTNGTRLLPEHITAISEIVDNKGGFNVQVSLDSNDPAINAKTRTRSRQTLVNIAKLSDIGARIIVATVVTKHNFASVYSTIESLSDYAKYFHLMTVQDVRSVDGIESAYGVSRESEDELWAQLRELADKRDVAINTPMNYEGYRGCATGAPCMAGFSHLVVDPSLAVRPCDRMTDLTVGYLHNTTIDQIWNSPSMRPILESPVPPCRAGRSFATHHQQDPAGCSTQPGA